MKTKVNCPIRNRKVYRQRILLTGSSLVKKRTNELEDQSIKTAQIKTQSEKTEYKSSVYHWRSIKRSNLSVTGIWEEDLR